MTTPAQTSAAPVRLEDVKKHFDEISALPARRIIICAGTGCVSSGSLKIYARFAEELEKAGLPECLELRAESKPGATWVSKSGCQGFCQKGPLVTIQAPEGEFFYCRVQPDDVPEIVEQTVRHGQPVARLLYEDAAGKRCQAAHDIPFYKLQQRTSLAPLGFLDPEDIREYIAHGGYAAARKAWLDMTPESVCKEMLDSNLRGRGGGGFPTGRKWDIARRNPGPRGKYVICNADEGDPGAFMDRSLMEGNPHAILEGLLIGARAIEADEGYIYVRAEYPLAVKRIRKAIADAEKAGLLGADIFGTGKAFRMHVMEGAGAFVCGEETAMIASIEGERGMPRPKPPFPAQSGLWGKPTIINNVETLSFVPLVIAKGAAWFRSIGPESSPGTKTFALTGHVRNTGLIEVPFGTTLRKIIFDIGGGVTDDQGNPLPESAFKAVQIGGPSGACLTKEYLDLPLDFDSIKSAGAMVGSGGLVVMNDRTCMLSIARFFMQFTQNESCGKCVLCREGTKQMLAMLDDIMEGRATEETLPLLRTLAKTVQVGSLCALGKTAPNPVISTLRFFLPEVEAHVLGKRCPTGQCKGLAMPEITEKCIGCGACVKKCPVGCITGEKKKRHVIDAAKCIKCGACKAACKFGAVAGI